MPVTVVLLAAGYATRLYPLTKDKPKALLPLADGLMLDEVIRTLGEVPDVRNIILVTNSRFAGQFREWQASRKLKVFVIDDGTSTAETRLGAIRDLLLARQATDPDDDLLVLGTDNIFEWSLREFVSRAQQHRPAPSVALWQAPTREEATRFGVVVRDAGGKITNFVEKSPNPPSSDVALCVYYFPGPMCGDIEKFLAAGGNADAPGYFVEWLVRNRPVYGILLPGAWYDIGTLEAYNEVQAAWRRPGATQKKV
jgi:glucose-1-phosphate thymidylyltransferase